MRERRAAKLDYLAHWPAPAPIPHAALKAWLEALPPASHAPAREWKWRPDQTYPCCSLCNTIFDTWARMTDVLRQLVPTGAITLRRASNPARVEGDAPRAAAVANYKSHNAKYVGALAAHYLHASWRGLLPAAGAPPLVYTRQKELTTLLLWLPLHITCTYLESRRRITNRDVKGDHNYQGNLDHLIAYHQYLCAFAASTDPGDLGFERLSVFYLKELPEAPPTLWDAALHPRLSDFVFDATRPDAANMRALVAHASDRLVTLYQDKTSHLVRIAKGLPPTHALPAFNADAVAYFIDLPELERLRARMDPGTYTDSIRYFIHHAGAAAILWQNHRYLDREEMQQRLVTDWLNALLAREFANIAEHRPQLSVYQGQLLYNIQCMLRPETLLGARDAVGSGAEVDLLTRVDNQAILEGVEASPRCSVWKAAHRLRAWNFTVAAPSIPMDVGAPAVLRARRHRVAALVASPSAAYPALGLRTPLLDALFAAPRAPLALILRGHRVRTSFSTWVSLSARLISSRLAITARRSTPPSPCHAAPTLDTSRRGWNGRYSEAV
jgi:hypothetical protein